MQVVAECNADRDYKRLKERKKINFMWRKSYSERKRNIRLSKIIKDLLRLLETVRFHPVNLLNCSNTHAEITCNMFSFNSLGAHKSNLSGFII